MCQLLRRGLIAALAPAGAPKCDIVVTDELAGRLFAIQVKTRRELGGDGGWHMSAKHETIQAPTLFYAFLDFERSLDDPPCCHVVPSQVVADTVRRSHEMWLSIPGKKDQQRKDGNFRRFLPDYYRMGIPIGCGQNWLDRYRDGWAQLEARP